MPAGIRVRHILVTIDFSEGTTDSIAYAFAIAQQYHAKVTLLHVLNDIDADISGRYRDQLIRTIRRDLEELLPGDARKLGRTAEKLVRSSAAPVLVIPPTPTTKGRQRRSKRAA